MGNVIDQLLRAYAAVVRSHSFAPRPAHRLQIDQLVARVSIENIA
jgi:hypothetical protein